MKSDTRLWQRMLCLVILLLMLCTESLADTLTVEPEQILHEVSPNLYGIFLEDINSAVDGGLYAELVRNRSFENAAIVSPQRQEHWEAWRVVKSGSCSAEMAEDQPLHENNPTYVHAELFEDGSLLLMNQGFGGNILRGGIAISDGQAYDLSLWLRMDADVSATVCLTDAAGDALSNVAVFSAVEDGWKRYTASLTATQTAGALLCVTLEGKGCADVDMVSLMPVERFGREWPGGGLRADLVEAMRGLKPTFLRFPGGCVAEGSYVWSNTYDWKGSVGPVEQRREIGNTWGGMQTRGVGFYEYFCLAEALGAEPVPVVHAGVLCQARQAQEPPLTMAETAAYAQDILDLIEFATGGSDTLWGSLRAEMGHPEPFSLRYLAIGNENWADVYFNRYEVLREAVKAAYPEITCIVAAGPVAEGGLIQDSWRTIRRRFPTDLVDEHYYMDSAWFPEHVNRYDSYPRTTKVFLGEYAAHEPVQGSRRPGNLRAALCEAAYLTGIERNSDLIEMACYAPLLCRESDVDWTPDLIWFSDSEVYLTPSWHVQRLFAEYRGDTLVASGTDGSLFQVVTRSGDEVQIKVVNLSDQAVPLTVSLPGAADGEAAGETLTGEPGHVNSFVRKDKVAPAASTLGFADGMAETLLPPWSLSLWRVRMTPASE